MNSETALSATDDGGREVVHRGIPRMTCVFNPPVPPALPVAGSLGLFPVRRIF